MRTITLILGLIVLFDAQPVFAQAPDVYVNPFKSGRLGRLDSSDQDYMNAKSGKSWVMQRNNKTAEYYSDCYNMDFHKGQKIIVRVDAKSHDFCRYPDNKNIIFDPYIILVRPDGSTDYDDDGGEGLNSLLDTDILFTGNHRICVTSFHRNACGNYFFRVSHGPRMEKNISNVRPPPPAPPRPPNPNATPINLRTVTTLNVFNNAYLPGNQQRSGPEYSRQRFFINIDQEHIDAGEYTLWITANYEFEGFMYLVDPNDDVVTYDDSRGNNASRIEWNCTTPGRWTVIVTTDQPNDPGGRFTIRATNQR